MASKFEARLDRMIEAAKASDRPYRTLGDKPWNLSAGNARTIVVGSGLSKSSDEVREREAKRIAKWVEQGQIAAKAKPKAAKPRAVQVPESAPDTKAAPDEAIEIPDAATAGVDAAYAEAEKARKRSRKPRKTGEGSELAKEIAATHEPVASVAHEPRGDPGLGRRTWPRGLPEQSPQPSTGLAGDSSSLALADLS